MHALSNFPTTGFDAGDLTWLSACVAPLGRHMEGSDWLVSLDAFVHDEDTFIPAFGGPSLVLPADSPLRPEGCRLRHVPLYALQGAFREDGLMAMARMAEEVTSIIHLFEAWNHITHGAEAGRYVRLLVGKGQAVAITAEDPDGYVARRTVLGWEPGAWSPSETAGLASIGLDLESSAHAVLRGIQDAKALAATISNLSAYMFDGDAEGLTWSAPRIGV